MHCHTGYCLCQVDGRLITITSDNSHGRQRRDEGTSRLAWLDDDVHLDAEGAVVADGAHVVAHALGVEVDDGGPGAVELIGVVGGALVELPPPHLHHVVEPRLEPEHWARRRGVTRDVLVVDRHGRTAGEELTEAVADVGGPVVRPGAVQPGARRDAPRRAPDDVVLGGRREEEGGQERGQGRAEQRPHPHRRWLHEWAEHERATEDGNRSANGCHGPRRAKKREAEPPCCFGEAGTGAVVDEW
jgi:hypothetical protein